MRLCGIDEAGRGALAGELCVCGVAFRAGFDASGLGLNDSKKLTPKRREELFEILCAECDYLCVFFGNKMVDEVGISACLARALRVILHHFYGCEFLYDGNCAYGVTGVKTLVKADAKVPEVSAASIIAKVSRDAQMKRFAALFPEFGYEIHKGYATALHLNALAKFGANSLTRKSFKVKKFEAGLFD